MTLSPTDRLDIVDLLTRADNAASDRDIEAYLGVIGTAGSPGRARARSILMIVDPLNAATSR